MADENITNMTSQVKVILHGQQECIFCQTVVSLVTDEEHFTSELGEFIEKKVTRQCI